MQMQDYWWWSKYRMIDDRFSIDRRQPLSTAGNAQPAALSHKVFMKNIHPWKTFTHEKYSPLHGWQCPAWITQSIHHHQYLEKYSQLLGWPVFGKVFRTCKSIHNFYIGWDKIFLFLYIFPVYCKRPKSQRLYVVWSFLVQREIQDQRNHLDIPHILHLYIKQFYNTLIWNLCY